MCRRIAFATALLLAGSVSAVVVPNDRETNPGTGVFLGPLSNAQRTYQLLIDDSQLTGLVGQQIQGLTWRLPSAATVNYPASAITYTSFDVRLSESVEPAARSLTFANNVVGAQTLVRSGPLTFDPAAFEVDPPAPHPFGKVIEFTTPYTYSGGNLLVELRHTGHNGTSSSVDAVLTSTAGYGTLFSACWTGSYTGVSGSQGNAVVTELIVVPEPASLGAAMGGVALLLARRRSR